MNRIKILLTEPLEVGDTFRLPQDTFNNAVSHGVVVIRALRFENIYGVEWKLNPWTGQEGNRRVDQITKAWLDRPGVKYLGNQIEKESKKA